jgi:hypothetical protein
MLRASKPNTGITAQAFADFNEKLYFDASIPADDFTIPEDIDAAKITPEEILKTLEQHFPANKSTGLSNLPT